MNQLDGVNEQATTAYIASSFIVVFLLLAPTFWHFEQRKNAGAGCLGFWIIVGNLVNGINSLIWRRDAVDRAPVWCDISVKFILSYQIACLCSALSIARFVARAVAPGKGEFSSSEIRRQNFIDYCVCFGVPVFTMATHIVYQPNRYAINRTTGCAATYVVTWPTFLLWLVWPPLVAVVAATYAIHTMRQLWMGRRHMLKLIESSGMPTSRFIRMMVMFCGYALCSLPMSIFYMYMVVRNGGGYVPYSWSFIHGHATALPTDHDFRVPTLQPLKQAPEFGDCLALIGALIYAGFFSFSKDTLAVYLRLLRLTRLGRLFPTISRKSKPNRPTVGRVTEISLSANCRSTRSTPARSLSEMSLDEVTETRSTSYAGPFQDVNVTSASVIKSADAARRGA